MSHHGGVDVLSLCCAVLCLAGVVHGTRVVLWHASSVVLVSLVMAQVNGANLVQQQQQEPT